MQTLRKENFKWIIILCHGGKFCLQVMEGDKVLMSRSDSKYVIRQKSGGRQLNSDRTKKIMSSVGSQMRRENERLLEQHIMDFMEEASSHIRDCEVIFLHAPGLNKTFFMSESRPLAEHGNKIKSIQFGNKKANTTEAAELVKRICDVRLIFK